MHLENNKMDRNLIGISVSNLNNTIGGLGVVAIGTSISAIESNKADKLQISTSCSKYLQRDEATLPSEIIVVCPTVILTNYLTNMELVWN